MQPKAFVRRWFPLLVFIGVALLLTWAPPSRVDAATVGGSSEIESGVGQDVSDLEFEWQVVVNNGVGVPDDGRTFNSYNPPSRNVRGLVVFRARSKGGMGGGGGPAAHGVFARDMEAGTEVTPVFDRTTLVPEPNNLETLFVEPPSFPRIDMLSDTVASRGNHPPAWRYVLGDSETRAGTTGIYTNPFGPLIAGMSNLGSAPGLSFFAVPGTNPPIRFEVFPGAPAVTDGSTIVFKGNYTVGQVSKTGVYYRDLTNEAIPSSPIADLLSPAGGISPAVLIANTDTLIPGSGTTFGSTAPPSAVGRQAVFAGFDNEADPREGGIYLAPLIGTSPPLTPLVRIGDRVPGEKKREVFTRLGEGVSFDGRFVAFWGAWGSATRALTLQCPQEGNKDRVAYCEDQYGDGSEPGDGFETTVPLHLGIFVHDTVTGLTSMVAKTPSDFTDFVYWNFSGRVPGVGGGEGDDEPGEPARWRSATFLAVSGLADGQLTDATFHTAFKARRGRIVRGSYVDAVDGIYLRPGPDRSSMAAVVETGMDGTLIDPDTPDGARVTEMGIERDGFRGDALVVNVRMGAETEEDGWAGIYLTTVPDELIE